MNRGAYSGSCAGGLSGLIFGLIAVDNAVSGLQQRSIFGFFTVPAKACPAAFLPVHSMHIARNNIMSALLCTFSQCALFPLDGLAPDPMNCKIPEQHGTGLGESISQNISMQNLERREAC